MRAIVTKWEDVKDYLYTYDDEGMIVQPPTVRELQKQGKITRGEMLLLIQAKEIMQRVQRDDFIEKREHLDRKGKMQETPFGPSSNYISEES